ncbi:MmgE/PrpD family protein [Marinobacter orientalis]|uniref:MmgE/PrpD family protein n=1 Tax=Marinobacter orientalis TaxID=1928859 RepID=A0A7Y0WTF1_9GAMM|nr:MmgE/PrpD family protein [Marinobacter orientalis]NMT64782.1 MmgE/PrpD family protein [Marinobacter orientalis]TGX48772.1 MmgE/PrpD family protein [Marinobacter orientalis]
MSDLSLPAQLLALDSTALPPEVYDLAQTCLLDLIGVAAGATNTTLAGIGRHFVLDQYPGNQPLLFSEGSASSTGAALYGGWLIDALDAHDGHVLTKGHAGVAILPAMLSLPETQELSGRRFLGELAIGYEIAIRAGISLHNSACDYHTSGAWNCLGVTAVAARLMNLSAKQVAEALGIAEFYGPRSQMMRCIEHPTMLKDGSGWGAMTGIASALLGRAGFTGAPAVLMAQSDTWRDLGTHWYFLDTYFKRYPVCYWAQPAIEASLSLRPGIADADEIQEVRVTSFHQAVRLHTPHPRSTEEAQYSLPWAVACALYRGSVDQRSVTGDLENPKVTQLARKIRLLESPEFSRQFPARRYATVTIQLTNGQELVSSRFEALGTPGNPIGRTGLVSKFHELAQPVIGSRADILESIVDALPNRPVTDLLAQLSDPIQNIPPKEIISTHAAET